MREKERETERKLSARVLVLDIKHTSESRELVKTQIGGCGRQNSTIVPKIPGSRSTLLNLLKSSANLVGAVKGLLQR